MDFFKFKFEFILASHPPGQILDFFLNSNLNYVFSQPPTGSDPLLNIGNFTFKFKLRLQPATHQVRSSFKYLKKKKNSIWIYFSHPPTRSDPLLNIEILNLNLNLLQPATHQVRSSLKNQKLKVQIKITSSASHSPGQILF